MDYAGLSLKFRLGQEYSLVFTSMFPDYVLKEVTPKT